MERRMLIILLSSSILIHFASAERGFFYVDQSLDWTKAQTHCREKFTDLVTVYDNEENQKLMALAEKRDDCIWMGLHFNFDRWRWSMGVPASSTDSSDPVWAKGQPNNSDGKQHCAQISTDSAKNIHGLEDKACSNTYYFICFDGNTTVGYILIKQQKTWKDAQKYCRTNHVDLASISSDAVSEVVFMLTKQNVYEAWIGLYRDPLTIWSDNRNTSFKNWEEEPHISALKGGCGCLWDATGKWKVLPCTHSKRFFCYGEKVDVRKQTVLKVKLQSEMDLNSKEIQHQVIEQMKNRLGSVGEANFTVKWRATRKMMNP